MSGSILEYLAVKAYMVAASARPYMGCGYENGNLQSLGRTTFDIRST